MSTSLRRGLPILFAVAAFSPAAAPAQQAEVPFAASEALEDGALGAIAGREDVSQENLSKQAGSVANTSVGDNTRTGDARIEGQAFQNMSGLSVLSVNTGNNVVINQSMNVNIAFAPAP